MTICFLLKCWHSPRDVTGLILICQPSYKLQLQGRYAWIYWLHLPLPPLAWAVSPNTFPTGSTHTCMYTAWLTSKQRPWRGSTYGRRWRRSREPPRGWGWSRQSPRGRAQEWRHPRWRLEHTYTTDEGHSGQTHTTKCTRSLHKLLTAWKGNVDRRKSASTYRHTDLQVTHVHTSLNKLHTSLLQTLTDNKKLLT